MKSWISLVLWATFLLLGLGQSLPYDDSNPSCSNFNVDENGIIRSSYIVALRPELTDEQVEEHIRWVEDMSRGHGIIEQRFRIGDFRGYSGYFDDYAIQAIRDSQQQVKYVEANSIVVNSAVETQTNAPWGLGRLSSQVTQRSMDPLALSHTYKYESSAGQDTWAYVIDSGVNTNHPDFQGRARFGAACCSFRCFEEEKYRNMHADHGTHVAGIVGGAQFGVAKRANIVSVKALWSSNEVGGGAAPATGIIAAIQWSLDDMEKNGRLGRSVINLSLGKACPPKIKTFDDCWNFYRLSDTEALEDAVKGAFKKGVLSVKGAGNQGLPAEWERPHGQDSVLTVGAIDHTGREWASSNYGKAIDILAPGVDIKSADSQNGVKLMSGTSMATPHITGLALNILALENIKSPRELKQRILSLAVSDVTPLDRGEKGRGSGIPRPVLTTVRRAYNGIDALQSQGSGQNGQQLTCPVPPQGVDLVNPGPSTSGQQQDRGSFWGPPTGSATYKHTGGYGSFSDQSQGQGAYSRQPSGPLSYSGQPQGQSSYSGQPQRQNSYTGQPQTFRPSSPPSFSGQSQWPTAYSGQPQGQGAYSGQLQGQGSYYSQPQGQGSYSGQSQGLRPAGPGSYFGQPQSQGSYSGQPQGHGSYSGQSQGFRPGGPGSYSGQTPNQGYYGQTQGRNSYSGQSQGQSSYSSPQPSQGYYAGQPQGQGFYSGQPQGQAYSSQYDAQNRRPEFPDEARYSSFKV